MIVQELMRGEFGRVEARQPLRRAERLMRNTHLDAVVVVEGARLAGLLTREDMRRASDQMDPRVGDAMCDDIPVSRADEPVEQCATRMVFHGIQHMPVVDDRDGRVLGIVTLADVRQANPRDV